MARALLASVRSPRFFVGVVAIWVLGSLGIALVVLVVAPTSPADGGFSVTLAGQATAPPDWAATAQRLAVQVDAALPSVALHRSAPPSGQGTPCLSWRPGEAIATVPGDGTTKAAEVFVDLGNSTDLVTVTVMLASGDAYQGLLPAGLSTSVLGSMPAPSGRPDGPGC